MVRMDWDGLDDCNRSVAIDRLIAMDRIDGDYTIYCDMANLANRIYFDDSIDWDGSNRLRWIGWLRSVGCDRSVAINRLITLDRISMMDRIDRLRWVVSIAVDQSMAVDWLSVTGASGCDEWIELRKSIGESTWQHWSEKSENFLNSILIT
jgi:hypothetical protein